MSKYIKIVLDLLSLLCGAILPFAFAPFRYYILAILAPVGLLLVWQHASPFRAAVRGWLFGLGMFGVGTSWVYVSIHIYGEAPPPLAVFLTALFISVLALFPALQGYFINKFFPKASAVKFLLIFPASWAFLEWGRSWFLTGFPWLYLSYSQVESLMRGYIPILGCYGVSFLVALSSGLVAYGVVWMLIAVKSPLTPLFQRGGNNYSSPFQRGDNNYSSTFQKGDDSDSPPLKKGGQGGFLGVSSLLLLILIWALGFWLATIQWTYPVGKPISVALIQGNIPQDLKWTPEHVVPTVKLYYELTSQHWGTDIIIWPEAAIPLPLPQAQKFLTQLDAQAKAHKSALITGIPVQVPQGFSYYNAMVVLGNGAGQYYKRHLVPFGEYVPFQSLLRGLIAFFNLPMSDMTEGPRLQPPLVVTGVKIAPFICYEIAYPQDLYRALPAAQLLVVISNDTWFGDSWAPAQHLQIGQFRALQGGRPLLFATNNGITAIINERGIVTQRIPQFQQAVLTGMVQPMQGSTPWAYLGIWPFVVGFLLLLAVGMRLG